MWGVEGVGMGGEVRWDGGLREKWAYMGVGKIHFVHNRESSRPRGWEEVAEKQPSFLR